mgnify:FL=1
MLLLGLHTAPHFENNVVRSAGAPTHVRNGERVGARICNVQQSDWDNYVQRGPDCEGGVDSHVNLSPHTKK